MVSGANFMEISNAGGVSREEIEGYLLPPVRKGLGTAVLKVTRGKDGA